MNMKELAAKLDGMEYGKRIPKDIIAQAQSAGLVILTGASDDLAVLNGAISDDADCFDGAISDDADCFDGGVLRLTKDGFFQPCEHDEWCRYSVAARNAAKKITAIWCDGSGYAWRYETDIPHEKFTIWESGEMYCRGIVFEVKNL